MLDYEAIVLFESEEAIRHFKSEEESRHFESEEASRHCEFRFVYVKLAFSAGIGK